MSWRHRSAAARALAGLLAMGPALVSASCGYALAGRGAFLPEHIQTIAVPLFVNKTAVFEVEQRLTERVRVELIGRGQYRVVAEPLGADAVLIGTISSITLAPASFTADRQASRYAATIVISVQLRDLVEAQDIWSNPSLVFREEYEVTTGSSAGDPNAFFGQASNALDRLSRDFARTVVSAILEAF